MAEAKPSGVNPLFLREEELRQGIEMVFYAYRDFTAEADALLAGHSLGRTHHRAIYFIGRNPGITMSDLLDILRITKQALSRALSQLIDQGFVEQAPGPKDRRQRLLHLTPKGAEIERQLIQIQRERIARAYREAGAEAVGGFRQVMLGIMNEDDRRKFLNRAPPPPVGFAGVKR